MEKSIAGVLIVSISPYFLERGNFWFEENLKQILEARHTQSFFQDNTVYVEKSNEIQFSQFLRQLDEMGYERVLEVQGPGELSKRGGILDVFPINLSCAVRIEFYGNIVENIEKLPVSIENEKEVNSFNDALDEYYHCTKKVKNEKLEKLEKRIEEQKKQLEAIKEEIEETKKKADYIYEHFETINASLEEAKRTPLNELEKKMKVNKKEKTIVIEI